MEEGGSKRKKRRLAADTNESAYVIRKMVVNSWAPAIPVCSFRSGHQDCGSVLELVVTPRAMVLDAAKDFQTLRALQGKQRCTRCGASIALNHSDLDDPSVHFGHHVFKRIRGTYFCAGFWCALCAPDPTSIEVQ